MKLAFALALLVAGGTATPSSAAQARATDPSLTAGIRQVQSGEFESGIVSLEAFVKKVSSDKTRSKDLVQAYLWIGVAYVRLREERKAMDMLVDAFRQDETLSPSEQDFPPEVLKVFRKAKEEAVRTPRPPTGGTADVPVPLATPAPRPALPSPRPPSAALVVAFIDRVRLGDFPTVRDMIKDNPLLVNATDAEFGATPLHWATLKGHDAVAGLLIAEGAHREAKNRDGETPLDVARRAGRTSIVALLPPDVTEAARTGDLPLIKSMLAKDPGQLEKKDGEFGATPLHWAALKGHTEVVRFLLDAGANPTAVNRDGESPLKVAQRAKQTEVVRLLTAAR